jgi:probable HAF family extracellular repeat protein
MRSPRIVLLALLAIAVAGHGVPASAQSCNCGLTGQWQIGHAAQTSSTGGYDVQLSSTGVSYQITVTGPRGILLQQVYSSAPNYGFVAANLLVINYFSGGANSVLYQLTDSTASQLRSIAGSIVPFRASPQGRFIVYEESGVWHLLRGDNLSDWYDYSDAAGGGTPYFGPQDRILYYTSTLGMFFVNLELASLVYSTPDLAAMQFTPCGDAVGLITQPGGADYVEMHSLTDGGVIGSLTFPTGVSPAFWTNATESYGEWTDGSGLHDLHIADNVATQACAGGPLEPISISVSPSRGIAGQPFSVTVGFNRPVTYSESGLGLIQLSVTGPAGGGLGVGGSWGATSATNVLETSTQYGGVDTVHITATGSAQSVHATYILDPTPPALSIVYACQLGPYLGGETFCLGTGLDHPAPAGGALVTLQSSDPALLPVPPSMTIPEGQQYGSVDVTAAKVFLDKSVTVTGTYNGVPQQANLTIEGPKPWQLTSFDPCLVGGQPLYLDLSLSNALAPGGFDLRVTSSDTTLAHPAWIHLTPGVFESAFGISTSPVLSPTPVSVFASYNGAAVQFDLTLQPAQSYTTNFLPGIANAINDAGQVAGGIGSYADAPYVWKRGVTSRMADLPGTCCGGATFAVSPHGWTTGQAGGHAFLWDGAGTPTDLTPGGGGTGYAVNDLGHVAGTDNVTGHAFFYDGTMHNLGTLGGASSEARGLTAGDVVVGFASTATGHTHAFRWTLAGGMVDLGLPPGATDAWAYAINSNGVVVGNAGPPFYACQWDGAGANFLSNVSGSVAYGVNDLGHVVGISSYYPVMWSGGNTTFLDQGHLGGVCGWTQYLVPTGINNLDQVVGTFNDGDQNPFGWMLSLGGIGSTTDAPPAAEPVARTLGLSVLGANPVRGAVALRCALPRLGPATLDLLDVTGRRVASRGLPGDGAVQFVRLDESAAFSPGIYFARLTQGARTMLTRVVLVH